LHAGLSWLSDRLQAVTRGVCVTLVLAMTALVLVAVFFRYALDSPIRWSEELARMLMVWTGLLGIPLALKEGEHVGMQAFLRSRTPRVRNWLSCLAHLLILVYVINLLLCGWQVSLQAQQVLPALQIRWMWSFLAVPVSAALQGVHVLTSLFGYLEQIFLPPAERREAHS
ncbi:MAG: TRAP transporter small permease, partial [Nitrospinota bacterium]